VIYILADSPIYDKNWNIFIICGHFILGIRCIFPFAVLHARYYRIVIEQTNKSFTKMQPPFFPLSIYTFGQLPSFFLGFLVVLDLLAEQGFLTEIFFQICLFLFECFSGKRIALPKLWKHDYDGRRDSQP
jgi:hypothetical protein